MDRPASHAKDAGGAPKMARSIRYGFANLLNFSGRDTRTHFRPYAGLLLIAHGAIAFAIVASRAMGIYELMSDHIARYPEDDTRAISLALRARPELAPGFGFYAIALCAVAAAYLALIAAALARRRHDPDLVESIGFLAFPALALALALRPSLAPAAFALVALSAYFYALVRGGAPERIVALTFLAGLVAGAILAGFPPRPMDELEPASFGLSVLGFLAYLLVALRANRFWPIWAAVFGGLTVLLEVAKLLNPNSMPWVYLIVGSIWVYPTLVALIVGTRAHRIRLARDGVDPAWTPRRRAGT